MHNAAVLKKLALGLITEASVEIHHLNLSIEFELADVVLAREAVDGIHEQAAGSATTPVGQNRHAPYLGLLGPKLHQAGRGYRLVALPEEPMAGLSIPRIALFRERNTLFLNKNSMANREDMLQV